MLDIKSLRQKTSTFSTKIHESQNIAIIPHNNPDGDAIGSALALYILLKKINKNVQIISPSIFPDFLNWMPESNKINIISKRKGAKPDVFSDIDLLIAVDFNSTSRIASLGKYFDESSAYKIVIDHHPDPDNFSDLLISAPEYCATSALIFDIIKNSIFHEQMDKDIATCIYTGIMTDTGCFSYNNSSTPETFNIVEQLLHYKIDKNKIYDSVYNYFSEDRMRFMGHILLNRMVLIPEHKAAYIYITAKDRQDFNEQFGDTENFVNLPLSIKNTVFSAIFIERDNFVKISFRSKGNFSVNEFSNKHFNGGGHTNAAGGESHQTLDNTIKHFTEVIINYSNELNNCTAND